MCTEYTDAFIISAESCLGYLKPDSMVAMYLRGSVPETGQVRTDVEHIQILKPDLDLKVFILLLLLLLLARYCLVVKRTFQDILIPYCSG